MSALLNYDDKAGGPIGVYVRIADAHYLWSLSLSFFVSVCLSRAYEWLLWPERSGVSARACECIAEL